MIWVFDKEFYDLLVDILTPRNKLILTVQKYDDDRKIKKLKRENKKLKKQNRKLKKKYDEILSSKSWKSTEILRNLKRKF